MASRLARPTVWWDPRPPRLRAARGDVVDGSGAAGDQMSLTTYISGGSTHSAASITASVQNVSTAARNRGTRGSREIVGRASRDAIGRHAPSPHASPTMRPKAASPKASPKMSPKASPRASCPKMSPKMSPKTSPKTSPKMSPKVSPKVPSFSGPGRVGSRDVVGVVRCSTFIEIVSSFFPLVFAPPNIFL